MMTILNALGGALQGIHILDMTHVWSGPYCTMMLGELGANVVKVESLTGDQFRQALDGSIFPNVNKNKRSIALNLKEKEGKEVVLKLASKADVLIENSLPGAMERLGLGYDRICLLNPPIIYCSISGFGQEGPFSERPAYEPVLQAMAGIMVVTGEPDRPPVRILPGFIDHCGGIFAAFGIVASVLEREKSGKGKRIDISLLDVALSAMTHFITRFKKTGELPQRYGSATIIGAPNQNFPTRDGYIYISAITDQMFLNVCRALELDDLAANPRYSTAPGRIQNRKALAEKLTETTKKYLSEELESKLLAMDVPCAKLRTIEEIIQEPHVQSRNIIEEIDYPPMGKVTTIRTPLFYSGEHLPTQSRAPLLGEHTREVLAELGYDDQKIGELIRRRIALQSEAPWSVHHVHNGVDTED